MRSHPFSLGSLPECRVKCPPFALARSPSRSIETRRYAERAAQRSLMDDAAARRPLAMPSLPPPPVVAFIDVAAIPK